MTFSFDVVVVVFILSEFNISFWWGEKSFVRKSHSTYGSFNTLNGGDERNHGSAEVISTLRDDESELNDAEMLNDVETMDDGEAENNETNNGDSEQIDDTENQAEEEEEGMADNEERK